MKNRLRFLRRCLAVLFLGLSFATPTLFAQIDFTFNYNGPDTIFVDESCTGILDWGAPSSVSATCNNPGCVILFFDVISISGGYAEGDSIPAGNKILITYYIQDNQGNDAFFGFDIDFIDTIPPMFDTTSMPADLMVACLSDIPPPPDVMSLVATDNCPPANAPPVDVVITYDGQSDVLTQCTGGTFTRTWTATDLFNNSTQYVQNITVAIDTVPPTITGFPTDLTEACEVADYAAWLSAQRAAFAATDSGCGIDTTYDDAPATFIETCAAVTVTFTAVDGCNLMTTAQATYTITDTQAPVITPPTVTDVTIECDNIAADPIIIIQTWSDSLQATDNCVAVIWTNDFTALTGGCGVTTGSSSVTYTAADDCGNTNAVVINFTVEDNNAPDIDTAPADTSVVCNGSGNMTDLQSWLNNNGGAVVSDACSSNTEITTTFELNGNTVTIAQIQDSLNTQLANSCGVSLLIDFVFSDACGNSNNASASFIVTDNVPPVWDAAPTPLVVECDGTADPAGAIAAWLAANGNGQATDACATSTISNDFTILTDSCGTTGFAIVTFTATDACGNAAPRQATIRIVDTTPPVWDTDPTPLEVECDGTTDPSNAIADWLALNGNGSASDACSGGVIYSFDYPGLTPGCGMTGSAIATFMAEDSCGNVATKTATVNIIDTTPPVWDTPPGNFLVSCDGTSDPTMAIADWLFTNGNGSASDACSGSVIYSNDFTQLTPACGTTGAATVTFTATDSCGNVANQTVTVTVIDMTDPVWDTDPSDLVLNCDGIVDIDAEITAWLAANGNGSASDICGNVTITNDYTALTPSCGTAGSATVTFTAADECGNTSLRPVMITVTDNTDPVIDVPAADITVECDAPSISFVDWVNIHGNAMASDGCSNIDNSSGSAAWTANPMAPMTGCGNTSSQLVEFVVEDACGRTASTMATYTVADNMPPVFDTAPSAMMEPCGGGNDQNALDTWIDNYAGATVSDGCGAAGFIGFDYMTTDGTSGNNVTFGNTASYPVIAANDCSWSVTITIRVQDECGNQNTATATFTIQDTAPPVLAGVPTDQMVDCNTIPAPAVVTATDNCDLLVAVIFSADTVMGTCPILMVINRTWSAMDACGNPVTATQVITVEDIDNPVLVGVPVNTTAACDNVPMAPVITATDGCDTNPMVAMTETDNRPNDGSCGDFNYTIIRTWTATDACGNTSTQSQEIVVSDTQAPTFTGPADQTLECSQPTDPMATGQPSNVMDQCDPNPQVAFADVVNSTGCGNSYVISRTWTVEDVCGNSSAPFVQTITVTDLVDPVFTTEPQDESMDCTDAATADAAFLTWVSNYAGATATDNCSTTGNLTWFAAVPGSYDINNPATFPGTAPGGLDAETCPSPTPGLIRSELVDFVVYDECSNAVASQALFSVVDNTPPVFDFCPADLTLDNDPGNCDAAFSLILPVISELCGSTNSSVSVMVTEPISSSNPGNIQTPVNPVTLTFSGLSTPPVTATGPVALVISLVDVDAEQATEFFRILGEDGSVLGQTLNTATQCANITTTINITAAQFNAWTTDGELVITLDPNIPSGQTGDFAINDICPSGSPFGGGSSVNASLNYNTSNPPGLVLTYSINGAAPIILDPIIPVMTTLPQGVNTVDYIAYDCSGNAATCSYSVTVLDTQPPVVNCPSDIVVTLGPGDDCASGMEVTLPLPDGIADNCGYPEFTQTQPFSAQAALLTFTFDPNYQEYIADDKTFDFIATAANAIGSSVVFTVVVEGDVEAADEYFLILGEDGNPIGVTEAGQPYVVFTPGDCLAMPVVHPKVTATIPVPVATYNTWAADGIVTLTAVSNTTFSIPPPGGPSDGINPSCTTFAPGTPDGQNDGASNMTIELAVTTVTPSYYTTGATTIPLTPMLPPVIAPTLNFALGTTDVFYIVDDLSGNMDTCSFSVTVADNTPPQVNCLPTTIFVNASGVVPYTLTPSEIDNNSTDNCGIVSMSVSPNTFDCSQAGTFVNVTLTATDASGNTGTCTTIVAIETEGPQPSYSIGLCGNDSLYLFANPPAAQGGVVYTYLWTGPNGFTSTLQNPVIPSVDSNDSGTYSVRIRGLTGCTALGTVEVLISDTPNTPIITANGNQLCTTDNLVLTTQQYSGNNVTYNWYAGIYPGGTYIATTVYPTFTLFAPLAAVTNTYFVIVEVDGCVSDASFYTMVTVTSTPVATTKDAQIDICEGEVFTIGTNTTGAGYTYSWTGPNGFTSNQANPPAFTNAATYQGGIYTLVISANGCPSEPDTTIVNVTPRPAKPLVAAPGVSCVGDDVVLFTNVLNADSYTWVAPNFVTQTTTTNSLTLFNVTLADAGNWTVYVTTNGCNSPLSDPVMVFVQPQLNVAAANNGPVCSGSMVQLSVNETAGASYAWSGPGGFSSGMQNPLAPAVAGTYTVTVTAGSGCSKAASTQVLVNEVPVIVSVSNNGTPCVTGAVDITLSVTLSPPDPGNYTYLWTGPLGYTSISSAPVLPNGTAIENGPYIVVVTNAAGCKSQPAETLVNVSNAPATPAITGNTTFCEGDLLQLTTNGYVGTNISFTWTTPNGTQITNIPSLTINAAMMADSGSYQVMVTVDGCDSNISPEFDINVKPRPGIPVITSNTPVCVGSTIELQTAFILGATYLWNGPAGFSANVHNPVIINATEDNEGAYAVQVIIDGCASPLSMPVNVLVNNAVAAPTVLNNGPICIDAESPSLILSVSPATAIAGASYTWYDAQTNSPIAGPTTALTVTITDFTTYTEGSYEFYVIAQVNDCVSPSSVPTTVVMNTIPNIVAFAGNDITVCNSSSITLGAQQPSLGSGMWTQVNGPPANIANPTSANTIVSGLQSSQIYTFQWTLSNGACGNYSADQVVVNVNGAAEAADAGLNIEVCNDNVATLNATASTTGATGTWTQLPAQQALGVVILNPADPNTQVTGLVLGNTYEFTWTLSNAGCGNFSSDQVIVAVQENATVAFAGLDFEVCADGVIQLAADAPQSGTGTWTTNEPGLTIIESHNPATLVRGFTESGEYTFVWTLDNGGCGATSDEITITFESAPVTVDDQVDVAFAGTVDIFVLGNDFISSPYYLEIADLPAHGQLGQVNQNQFVYSADPTFAGTDQFSYTVCSQSCPDVCSTALVNITIGEDADCKVPTIFTPNNDLVNDYFIVPCLATNDYPNNVVSIFNQWGDEVFRAAPYQNNWQGTYKGEDLPVGTYYFVINFGTGQEPRAGFLVLER